jgi:hypothetical protein
MGNRYNQKQDTTNTRLGALSVSAATGAVGTTTTLVGYLKQLVTNQLAYQVTNLALDAALERCVAKTDGAVLSGTDDLFTITGGPIQVMSVVGIVTTLIVGAANGKLTLVTTTPAATVDMSAGAVAIDDDAAGTSYRHINTTAVLTPVTAGFVMMGNAFATQDTQFLVPIGTIGFNCSAARVGVIAWYLRYKPLSPLSVVVAAA